MRRLLITGATGFVGGEFLRRLLTWTDDVTAVLLVRETRRERAAARVDALCRDLFGSLEPAERKRIQVVEGDLVSERLGLDDEVYDEVAASITEIWHFGADVRFDQPLDEAERINVGGTLKLAALGRAASRYGHFARFHHVSTYAAARRDDTSWIEEAPVAGSRFRNSYERTKAEAELRLSRYVGDMPITIHRLPIVVGESRTGWTPKFDTFYFPIRLLIEQLDDGLSELTIPVHATARLNAAPVDIVADALFVLAERRRGPSGEILHLVPGPRAPFLADTLRRGMELFLDARLKYGLSVPRLPAIVPLDDISPEHLAVALGEEVSQEIVDLVMHVMPYAFDASTWANDRLREALQGTGIEFSPVDEALAAIVEFPVRTSWGAVVEPRPLLGPKPPV